MRALSPFMGIPMPPHHLTPEVQDMRQPRPLKRQAGLADPAAGADAAAGSRAAELLLGARAPSSGEQSHPQQHTEVPSVVVGVDPSQVLPPGGLVSRGSIGRLDAGAHLSDTGAHLSSSGISLSSGTAARFGVRCVPDACVSSGGAAAQARLSARPLLRQLEQVMRGGGRGERGGAEEGGACGTWLQGCVCECVFVRVYEISGGFGVVCYLKGAGGKAGKQLL